MKHEKGQTWLFHEQPRGRRRPSKVERHLTDSWCYYKQTFHWTCLAITSAKRRHTKLTVVMYVITNTLMECHLLPVDVRKMDLNKCNGLIVWWKHKNKHLANTGWRSWCLPQKVTEQLRFTVWQHLISGYWASLPETGLTIRQRQSQNFLVTTFLFFGAS